MTEDWTGPSPERTRALLAGEVPVLPEEERRTRRAALAAAAEQAGCDLVLVYGADRSGSGVPWLTGWGVTREAALLVDLRSEDDDELLLQFHNHVRLASERAKGCSVRWAGPDTTASLVELLAARGGAGRTLGLVGPVRWQMATRLGDAVTDVVDLGPAYTRLRMVKSDHELDLLTVGAELSDAAALAMRDAATPGTTDHQLLDAVERAYVPRGGATHIHYVLVTSMDAPARPVPAQVPHGQVVPERNGVVVTEISAKFAGYAGQVLRTMTPEDDLTPRYRELHDVAQAAFEAVVAACVPGATPAELVAAAGVVEEAGFTTDDDLVHGFGGGYLPPVVGSASRPAGPMPDVVLEPGMCVVVQPNVISSDGTAGVQTGELVVVTHDGPRSLHTAPAGPWTGAGR